MVPADTDRFGEGHGFNTSPSEGTGAAVTTASARIREKAGCSPARRSRPTRRASNWTNGAWAAGDGGDAAQAKTIEDIALYAHGTGQLPPGVEGGLDAQAVYRD